MTLAFIAFICTQLISETRRTIRAAAGRSQP